MIEQINTPNGRFYRTPDGNVYPSVTTVLGSIPNPELDKWKASVGEEVAKRISNTATRNGTAMHSFCENFLLKTPQTLSVIEQYQFASIIPYLSKIDPIGIEEFSYSDKLKVAGSYDCLGYYDGILSLIDFKTTSKLKHNGEFDSYWMQTAAYAAMVYERKGLLVKQCVIIMQNIKDAETYEFKDTTTTKWLRDFRLVRNAYENQQAFLPGN